MCTPTGLKQFTAATDKPSWLTDEPQFELGLETKAAWRSGQRDVGDAAHNSLATLCGSDADGLAPPMRSGLSGVLASSDEQRFGEVPLAPGGQRQHRWARVRA
jgi:hypothetical protein